ncbi:MAG: helix-turn-helix domain-containing protein [Bryobacteraceae bacterium]
MISLEEQRGILRCRATDLLAQIHWYVLRSSELMRSACFDHDVVDTVGSLRITRPRRTSFGKEVGRDEIEWWVNRKETDLEGLRQRTQTALDAAQRLTESVRKLKGIQPQSYEELLVRLRDFAETHTAAIETVCQFVKWLNDRDSLAPSLLLTFKVWGSTRISDRTVKLSGTARIPEKDEEATLMLLAEVALGLTVNGRRRIDSAYGEVSYEMFESMAESDYDSADISVPVGAVVRRATWLTIDDASTYFSFLRDSLRDILNEIGKRADRENLITSDSFWRYFVRKSVCCEKVETDLWDFKETLAMWHAPKGDERRRAKVSFSRDLASFANAKGGCLVIGITDDRKLVGVVANGKELENRIAAVHEALATHLVYPRPIYRLQQVLIPDGSGDQKLCVIVVVAQACEPVGVDDGTGQYTYPVRSGTGTANGEPRSLTTGRTSIQSDNFDFLTELAQFVRDN